MRSGSRVGWRVKPFCRRSSRKTHRSHAPGIQDRRQKGFFTSIRVMNAVVADRQTKGGERLLLLCMARYAADDGSRVFPSVATLADDTQQTRAAVQRQLRSLQKKGLISSIGLSWHGPVNYKIAVDKLHGGAYVVRPSKTLDAQRGVLQSKKGIRRMPDSSTESPKTRQEPLHKATPKGDEALKAIGAYLPQFKSASKESA